MKTLPEYFPSRRALGTASHWLRLLTEEAIGLTEIPEAIYDLKNVKEINLSGNNIHVVPERIRELSKLERVVLYFNPIERLPNVPGLMLDWKTYLRCREKLSDENIVGLWIIAGEDEQDPAQVGESSQFVRTILKLSNLQYLHIGPNADAPPAVCCWWSDQHIPASPQRGGNEEIGKLIAAIGDLHKLETLQLFDVTVDQFPVGIRNLRLLQSLDLICAGLKDAPDWLEELPVLRSVDFSGNAFEQFPTVLFRIPTLEEADLSAFRLSPAHITKIPAEILQSPNLKTLNVRGQPIDTPPPEIVKEGVAAVRNYWRQQHEAGVDYLCEAKVLIVGEAGAGKTTLARKIENPSYQLQPTEESTKGIEVTRWHFPSAVRVKQEGGEKMLQSNFLANIWDFGGQEIYHTTHQFFLTRRSLYVLVSDDRKEDTDFNYWLQTVELFSNGSPLLIVQNEKQDRRRDINLPSLRSRFANLKNSYCVNLATNRGVDDLVDAIRDELERLPHIGVALPKTWKSVRDALEKSQQNYIRLEEYLTICRAHGFQRPEDGLQLSGYLHDLGICLHFQDDPLLKNTVILKSKWGTDAVYRVLDDDVVNRNRGQFGRDDLARIWNEVHYAWMRDELLRLMLRFRLCYKLPEGNAYIAPQLLSPAQPAYKWNGRDNLVLRYEYDFMPKGLLTRLIVALHYLISQHSLVWKSGVILEREATRAQVIEDYPRRRIDVRIEGADRRGLLAIVDDGLDRIHRSFMGLKYEKFLPCNCPVCSSRDDPYSYPLAELKEFAESGDSIQCRVSRKLINAAKLIKEVMPSAFLVRKAVAESAVRKEVYVSYAWNDESKAVVDQLDEVFTGRDITFRRDRNEIKYKNSIRDFMRRLGRGKYIIIVLSKGYLESKNCMFELTEIADCGEMRDRVFPILLEDAKISDPKARVDYVKYWEDKKKELDETIKGVGSEKLEGIREEIDLYTKIRNTIAGIIDILGDMNARTLQEHKKSNFAELLQTLGEPSVG